MTALKQRFITRGSNQRNRGRMLNSFINYYGEVVNGLKIIGIYGRDQHQAPIWQALCTKCGTTGQTFEHRFLVEGSAKCKSGICGRTSETTRATVGGTSAAFRSNNPRARLDFDPDTEVTYT